MKIFYAHEITHNPLKIYSLSLANTPIFLYLCIVRNNEKSHGWASRKGATKKLQKGL